MNKVSLNLAPPKSAYSFNPVQSQILIENEAYVERLIFKDQVFKDWEISAIEQLERLLKTKNLDKEFNLDRSDLLRFLYGQGWDTRKSVEAIQRHFEWIAEWPKYQTMYPLVQSILNSGGLYIHGRDKFYRPLIVLRPAKIAEYPYQVQLACTYFFLELILDNMMIPGKIENWVMLIDFKNFNQLNQNSVKKIIVEVFLHYQCRLAKAYVFNHTKLWKNFINLLPQNTFEKFSIIDSTKSNVMLKDFAGRQLEIKYGGSSPNLNRF